MLNKQRERQKKTMRVVIFVSAFAIFASANVASAEPDHVTVTTRYGAIQGRTYNVSDTLDLDVFLGVPYAKPPVGELRLARPEPIQPWSPAVQDATKHGAQCVQRPVRGVPALEGVPFSEDCLFLDIYKTRNGASPDHKQAVMVYIHMGGFYSSSGAKYNFTNLALKGVVVVSISYRLDIFGFLSTQDDVIPGNFGLLDAQLALDFVKEIISDFGGDSEEITLFGISTGAVTASLFALSPLSRGKFNKIIAQSGCALSPWAISTPDRTWNIPADLAFEFGRRVNCSLAANATGETRSRDLLTCLRATPVDTLVQESILMQERDYQGSMVFVPVTGDAFGILPETPAKLLSNPDDLEPISSLVGYTNDDASTVIPDTGDDALTYPVFQLILNRLISRYVAPSDVNEVKRRVEEAYLPADPASLAPVQLRVLLVRALTDLLTVAPLVQQVRLFGRATGKEREEETKAFFYRFDYRPSYSDAPLWRGVVHAADRGFVLGLPEGPDQFYYPNTTAEDRHVADIVTDMWANFAKYGDPTPRPFAWPKGLRWPVYGNAQEDQKLLVIGVEPKVEDFDRNRFVEAWTGESHFSMPDSCSFRRAHLGLFSLSLVSFTFMKIFFAL